jgi:hypothetical protein
MIAQRQPMAIAQSGAQVRGDWATARTNSAPEQREAVSPRQTGSGTERALAPASPTNP